MLPQPGLGRSPSRNRIWCILALECDIRWPHFNDFPLYSMVFSLNFQLSTKRYVPKALLSPFIDGIAMAQTFGYRR